MVVIEVEGERVQSAVIFVKAPITSKHIAVAGQFTGARRRLIRRIQTWGCSFLAGIIHTCYKLLICGVLALSIQIKIVD
jgi:hypothetical protein